ncbi:DUF3253 domain-containing protein [Mycobacterium sp. ITM-2016-00317]|uniref:DUF3253 domain-containing protein n=1 Tax=Mycobacterium sp. ITM-2016-00317 TaxID=2099694 RepID=UPI000D445D88|nr:DUF3253 domain-containing protein [Mycobacterium sp. ITM-2016-00317]WNG85296.1 DUF3253 domain-containing protein [Mycobacterium sp. ITM-2016-00317]
MTEPRGAELARIADGDGPGSEEARRALSDAPITERLRGAILALAAHRGPDSSTCPSDATRAVGGQDWRELMADARDLARELARCGAVEISQRGRVLNPEQDWRGPIRISVRAHR